MLILTIYFTTSIVVLRGSFPPNSKYNEYQKVL